MTICFRISGGIDLGSFLTKKVFCLFLPFFPTGGITSSYSCMRNICMYSLSVSTHCYNFPSKNSGVALTGYAGVLLHALALFDVNYSAGCERRGRSSNLVESTTCTSAKNKIEPRLAC